MHLKTKAYVMHPLHNNVSYYWCVLCCDRFVFSGGLLLVSQQFSVVNVVVCHIVYGTYPNTSRSAPHTCLLDITKLIFPNVFHSAQANLVLTINITLKSFSFETLVFRSILFGYFLQFIIYSSSLQKTNKHNSFV